MRKNIYEDNEDELQKIDLKKKQLDKLQKQMVNELRNKKQTNDTLQKAQIEATTKAQSIADSLAPPAAPMRF